MNEDEKKCSRCEELEAILREAEANLGSAAETLSYVRRTLADRLAEFAFGD